MNAKLVRERIIKFTKKFSEVKSQMYTDDKRFVYLLKIITGGGDILSRVYSTLSPLNINHRINLGKEKSFLVVEMVHVTYFPGEPEKITRPTTIVHVGIVISKETVVSGNDLTELGFTLENSLIPITIH